jgi:ribonuclease HI
MATESLVYVGFIDRAIHHTQNLASSTWVIYSPEGLLVSSGGICLGPSMNNVVEYNAIIELLRDAISHGIHSIEVHLDYQLVVCQLNGRYHVCDPTLLRRFLRVRLLERQFDFITYFHIPISYNHVSDAYTNYVLNWNLSH